MASTQDFFETSDTDTEAKRNGLVRISSSLDLSKQPDNRYYWIILFNWDCNARYPFVIYKLSLFTEQDIKKEWITGNLGLKSRMLKLGNLSPFPGGVFSLFGKVEIGNLIFKNILTTTNTTTIISLKQGPT